MHSTVVLLEAMKRHIHVLKNSKQVSKDRFIGLCEGEKREWGYRWLILWFLYNTIHRFSKAPSQFCGSSCNNSVDFVLNLGPVLCYSCLLLYTDIFYWKIYYVKDLSESKGNEVVRH